MKLIKILTYFEYITKKIFDTFNFLSNIQLLKV